MTEEELRASLFNLLKTPIDFLTDEQKNALRSQELFYLIKYEVLLPQDKFFADLPTLSQQDISDFALQNAMAMSNVKAAAELFVVTPPPSDPDLFKEKSIELAGRNVTEQEQADLDGLLVANTGQIDALAEGNPPGGVFTIPNIGPQDGLGQIGRSKGIIVSDASEAGYANSNDYGGLVRANCTMASAENSAKHSAVTDSRDSYNFGGVQSLINTYPEHATRAHGPIWPLVLGVDSSFINQVAVGDRATALQWMENYQQALAASYDVAGAHSWDVVNEPVDNAAGAIAQNHPWGERVGEDWVVESFRVAAATGTKMKLCMNDADIEFDGDMGGGRNGTRKREAFVNEVRRVQQAGHRIEAVGVEAHLHIDDTWVPEDGRTGFFELNPDTIIDFCQDMAVLGLDVYVTEFDIRENPGEWGRPDRSGGNTQERAYRLAKGYLSTFFSQPNVKLFQTWQLREDQSWLEKFLRPQFPGVRALSPFRPDNTKTRVYDGIKEALQGAPVRSPG